MRRTEFTYGQFDQALRALGFTSRLLPGDPPALQYEHKETGASFMIPPFPKTDYVVDYHLLGARTIADNFGVAEPREFDALLTRSAETNGASVPPSAKKRRKPAPGQ